MVLTRVINCGPQQFDGDWDIHIDAPKMGLDLKVKQHANTTLKGPLVGKNIPTVAEVTQGEVVKVRTHVESIPPWPNCNTTVPPISPLPLLLYLCSLPVTHAKRWATMA